MLWLGSSSGLILFNPVNEKIIHFLPDSATSTHYYSLNSLVKTLEDKNGNIWCATTDGLLKVEPKHESNNSLLTDDLFNKGFKSVFNVRVVRFHQDDTSAGVNQITELYQDSQHRIWAGGKGCLYIINPETNAYYRIDDGTRGRSRIDDPFISSIIEDDPDKFWVGTGNGIYMISNIKSAISENHINKALLEFTPYLEMKLITGLLHDNEHRLWIGTYLNGLVEMQYDEKGKPHFMEVYPDLLEPEGEGIRTVFSLLKDHTGLIWAGHQYGGIRKFDPGGNYFTSYSEIIRQHFDNYDVNPITKDDEDNLWIGTYGDGLHKITRDGKVASYAVVDEAIPGRFGNGVISLLRIDKDIIWIGAANGIWQFNTRSGKSVKLFTETPFGELNDYIHDMQKIEKYVLFTLWGEGVFVYNLVTQALRQYKYDPHVSSGLRSDINYSICPMRNGEIYFGGSRGLTRGSFSTTTGQITFLPLPFTASAMHDPETINKLYEDKGGILWCGTNNGILMLDLKSGTARRWTTDHGLSNEVIRSIEEDSMGNLWLGTANGLSMLNSETGLIKVFNKSNGTPVEIHAHHSSFRDRDGTLYFGGIGSFYCFQPANITVNEYIPPIAITEFRLFNKPVKNDLTKKIVLAHNQDDLSFTFAALDYHDPAQNKYAYKLVGYQQEWVETGADNRIATYTNLSPGEYMLRVKGSNNDGLWNEEGTTVKILIKPPIWKTTIAYAVYGILFLLILRGYITWRTRILRKEKISLEKQVNQRTAELQEVNTILEGQKEELLQQKEELQSTLENLQKTQEQLIESEKMAALGSLVAGVAHEINTPVGIGITAITNLTDELDRMAELYNKDALSRGDFREFLQMGRDAGVLIQKNLERTASLVQSFKQLSVDQVSEQQRTFGLKDYLRDILCSLQPTFKQKEIELIIECDDRLEINSYPGVYAQVFTNLLLNSWQHGFHEKTKGVISIKAELKNGTLNILYSDDGAGINKKDLPHIFEPFYTSDHRKGTGLGLNIVYNLIRQKLHGNIACASEEGKGALFKIEVPVR